MSRTRGLAALSLAAGLSACSSGYSPETTAPLENKDHNASTDVETCYGSEVGMAELKEISSALAHWLVTKGKFYRIQLRQILLNHCPEPSSSDLLPFLIGEAHVSKEIPKSFFCVSPEWIKSQTQNEAACAIEDELERLTINVGIGRSEEIWMDRGYDLASSEVSISEITIPEPSRSSLAESLGLSVGDEKIICIVRTVRDACYFVK